MSKSKSKVTPIRTPSGDNHQWDPADYDAIDQDGARLAIQMMKELEQCMRGDPRGVYQCGLERYWRGGAPHRDIVREYLDLAQAAGPNAMEGFTRLLSDFVSNNIIDSAPDAKDYERAYGQAAPVGKPEGDNRPSAHIKRLQMQRARVMQIESLIRAVLTSDDFGDEAVHPASAFELAADLLNDVNDELRVAINETDADAEVLP